MSIGIGLGSAIAIYFIIWWLLFFAVLPWGNRKPHGADEHVDGAEPGAPRTPLLRKKLGATTVLSFVVFGVFVAILNSGLTLDDIPLPSPPGVN